jgi:hypothetical protein
MIVDILIILITIVGGGLLLFPVKVRFSFRGQKNGNRFSLHLFRKKIWSLEEDEPLTEMKEDSSADEEIRASEEDDFDNENPWKKEKEETVKASTPAPVKTALTSKVTEPAKEKAKPKRQPKKASKKSSEKDSSDEEFLTLILEPGFDRKILKSSFRMSRSFFRIFHCYFEPTVVEGLRFGDYEEMGYAMGGLNFLCGVIPLFHNWQFLMDWEGNRPLRIEGGFVASFSIARILGFGLVSSVSTVELVVIYLMNRRRYKKNPERFRLIFWRRWLVRFLCKN